MGNLIRELVLSCYRIFTYESCFNAEDSPVRFQHSHPYISGMVSNGSAHYDHDRDGTHTQLGGEHTGCEAKFRNKDYETQLLIRYVGDTLSVWDPISLIMIPSTETQVL